MIFQLLQILIINLLGAERNAPKRLNKQEKQSLKLTDRDVQLILLGMIITITLVIICLVCITSCTDSGLVYNNHTI